jgi:proteic killer suppression protein
MLYENGMGKGIPADLADKIVRLLDHLNAARIKEDLNIAGFHQLKGDRKGTYAWKVTANWRLTFRFENGDALDVDLEDYH